MNSLIVSTSKRGNLMPEGPFRVVARFKAVPEKVEEVRALLSALVEPTRKEPGCLVYELLQNVKDPADFTFLEEWESDSAFDTHTNSDHIKAMGPKLKDIAETMPEIGIYTVVA
jgi:quinol monooxygenase YgiN